MKFKDEDPDNLGGLGDMLPAEVLKMLNDLLERMQQYGHTNQGSKIELVYVASGGQHVETQINLGTHPNPPKGREKKASETEKDTNPPFNADTPLSALFRESHHEELRQIIESWRPYLKDNETDTKALELSHFEFDKDRIYSNKVYRDLCGLDVAGALKVPLSQLARYLADHSNLSRSYATLYQQLKYYRGEWT